ncbi:MAG: hypothetical protein H6Q66_1375 [Firmicutes bacterium]|nr:hypothetical protein [Bacillota bacterium]
MATLLYCRGYPITGIASRTQQSASRLADQFPGAIAAVSPEAVTLDADLVFLTVPDRFIGEVVSAIAAGGGFRPEQSVFHTCGSMSAEVLKPAQLLGAFTGSIHPLQSFADIETAKTNLPGSYFALDGDEQAIACGQKIIAVLGGHSFFVPAKDRALYHAAACVASNYLVSLTYCAAKMYEKFGLSSTNALHALAPLIQGTLANLQKVGLPDALTGPISRGDLPTIEGHFKALSEFNNGETELYKVLGLYTLQIALEKASITEQQAMDLSITLGK